MNVGAGLALTTNPSEAATHAVAQARETLGGESPQLAVLFASPHFLPAAGALVAKVAEEAGFPALIGCIAESVVGAGREVEFEPAVSVWLGSGVGPVETFSMEFLPTSTGGAYCGYNFDSGVHLMVCDPYTF